MKKILFTLFFALLFTTYSCTSTKRSTEVGSAVTAVAVQQLDTGTVFLDITFQEALEKAGQEDKLVFIDCYTQTCIPCKMMIKKVFPHKTCGTYINSNFVPIMMDMENGEGIDIAERYNVQMYPTYLIISPDGNKIGEIIGAEKNVDLFVSKIKDATNGVKSFGNN